MIRKCVTGYKIGPLFADNKIIAEKLFKKLNNFTVGSQIFLDIPEVNKEALKLVNKYKMKPMLKLLECIRKNRQLLI